MLRVTQACGFKFGCCKYFFFFFSGGQKIKSFFSTDVSKESQHENVHKGTIKASCLLIFYRFSWLTFNKIEIKIILFTLNKYKNNNTLRTCHYLQYIKDVILLLHLCLKGVLHMYSHSEFCNDTPSIVIAKSINIKFNQR